MRALVATNEGLVDGQLAPRLSRGPRVPCELSTDVAHSLSQRLDAAKIGTKQIKKQQQIIVLSISLFKVIHFRRQIIVVKKK